MGNFIQEIIMSDTLVVVSKVKAYVKHHSGGFSTSASVANVLTKMVEAACKKAIESAKNDGRKTVMDRDFPPT